MPTTSANEGSAYTYQLSATDPDGKSVTFALTSGPTGATLAGSTIKWTPTPAQSRVPNSFTVTATTADGGTATQSWSVTPSGTVHVRRDLTIYTATGTSTLHAAFNTTDSSGQLVPMVYVLVPQSDGSFRKMTGTDSGPGTLDIPNVPGGYFWLVNAWTSYWTSSSDIDLGADLAGNAFSAASVSGPTTFNFDFSGLDPIQPGDELTVTTDITPPLFGSLLDVSFPPLSGGFSNQGLGTYEIGGTTYKGTSAHSNVDYATAANAFVGQYRTVALGDTTTMALGASLQIPSPLWTTGTTNDVSGTLSRGQQTSIDLNVKGSAWQALLNGVTPSPASLSGSKLRVAVLPYLPQQSMSSGSTSVNIPLVASAPVTFGIGCGGTTIAIGPGPFLPVFYPRAAIATDTDLGSITYSDPFTSSWPRVFSFCQGAAVSFPLGDGSSSATLALEYGVDTTTPANPVVPLVGPVRDATISGNSLFAPSTVNTATPTLSWSAPSLGTPYGYSVMVIDLTATESSTGSGRFAVFVPELYETSKTSVTVRLTPGHKYVFQVIARMDARANVETSPFRTALPRGYATAVSASITVSSSAAPVVVN